MKRSSLAPLFSILLLAAGSLWAQKPAPANAAASAPIGDIQLTQIRLDEAARLISQVGQANTVVTGKVAEAVVSLYLRDATVEDMVRNLCRAAGVWYRHDPQSNTYVIMSGEEYQKDLAIVRDERTRVFTLRHHNVVAAANAVKALFGARVALAVPVEEMPPQSLGAGSRTGAGGARGGTAPAPGGAGGTAGSAASLARTGGGIQGGAAFDLAQSGSGAGGRAGGAAAAAYDPAQDLARLSQARIDGQARLDAQGRPVLGVDDLQDMAGRQGPAIHVTYNKLNNLLLARSADATALEQIAELVKEMDRPPRQVLLEMKILEVTLDDGFRSVFDIGLSGGTTSAGPFAPNGVTAAPAGSNARHALAGGNFDVEQDATFVWQLMSDTLRLRFQLLAQENKLKTLASPMLVAANNLPARLFIGDERVLTVGASSQSVTGTTGATNTTITVETEKRDVGQTLSILPRINGDRSVTLTIDQDSSTVRFKDTSIPITTANGQVIDFPIDTVNTASLQVTAHARDGMTVAVGGMIRDRIERNEEKVPLLGDMPVLGTLFKRDVRAAGRSQIVLLVTPRVLENPEEADAVARRKESDLDALAKTLPKGNVLPKPEKLIPQEVD